MKENLEKILKKYNFNINSEELEEFETYYNMMINYNKIHNLTNITEIPDVLYKHYLDSILPLDIINNESKVIDLGCGGGFPSIPLKIMNKTLDFTAVDSVNKKTDFVKMVSNTLNFDKFNVFHARIEELAYKEEFREKFDYVVSRAVAPLNIILEYSAPFTKDNGYILCYKGSKYQEEINEANNALKLLNCKIEEIKEFYIDEIEAYRYILVIKKLSKIDKKYPRKQNKPRLQPL